jgi:hypothetical protein
MALARAEISSRVGAGFGRGAVATAVAVAADGLCISGLGVSGGLTVGAANGRGVVLANGDSLAAGLLLFFLAIATLLLLVRYVKTSDRGDRALSRAPPNGFAQIPLCPRLAAHAWSIRR